MKIIQLFPFLFLLSFIAKAQDKATSTQTKDSVQKMKVATVTDPEQTQSAKVIICGPSRSSLMQILYILNGKIINQLDFSKINPNNIKSMKILHPDEAKLIYGEQGANGAILIITKK
ncbi:TonB-dependent receptor [Flavobacterium sp. P21]|uniref:TonB-dependent receptor n=1 Tax=Flavobacterium sp. P21 TaxID=3423948 RepID=UPI003D679471